MMPRYRRITTIATLVAVLTTTLFPPATYASWPFKASTKATTVELLASAIDRLEKHLDEYGTVVAKSPDVWGEARLTKYRQEYEEVMHDQLGGFGPTINASISRSDAAFVTNALALQAAMSGPRASILGLPTTTRTSKQTPVTNQISTPPVNLTLQGFGVTVPSATQSVAAFDAQGNPIYSTTETATTTQSSEKINTPEIATGNLISPPTLTTGKSEAAKQLRFEQEKIALEPTVALDQRSRYLNHLHQLRRISDGDDKSDAPGYALHLVRLPISVLPGKKTREGYGAEVNIIAKPHLHEKLLPDTFRGLVINDLVDQWSFPMAKFLDTKDVKKIIENALKPPISAEGKKKLDELVKQLKGTLEALQEPENFYKAPRLLASADADIKEIRKILDQENVQQQDIEIALTKFDSLIALSICRLQPVDITMSQVAQTQGTVEYLKPSELSFFKSQSSKSQNKIPVLKHFRIPNVVQGLEEYTPVAEQFYANLDSKAVKELDETPAGKAVEAFRLAFDAAQCGPECKQLIDEVKKVSEQLETLGKALTELTSSLVMPSLSTTPSRRAQQPYPMTLTFDVMGEEESALLAQRLLMIKDDSHNQSAVLILDMQKILAEEFNAAYDFLNANEHLWNSCTSELAAAVRRKDYVCLSNLRVAFFNSIVSKRFLAAGQEYTKVLAWAILVESALLNEKLVEDMGNLAAAKNAYHLRTDWLPFYGPNPPFEAVQAFNDYVACRWPIHVMAIDPVTQDQNVADSFSQRRELQLALSLAFASGRLGVQNFTRMARQLTLDMETVALHRTNVGFSHGNDTFGWRFLPRVQSPETKGNMHAFAQTLFTGGPSRDALLKQSRLEPGMRECTAIVIMPSFVPYVIFDMRTNWFKLSNPKVKELDLRDGVGLSREIVQVRGLSQQCAKDAHLYRQDEVYRLNRAVEQLEKRLPLQTTYVQMPFENSLGGFEFFNTGTPDLAPELKGFYGEPGISQDHDTELFLVGDHFSVHDTRVIVGGQLVAANLLSRQIMRVTVKKDVTAIGKFVDVHVATPYGISNHIDIPLLDKKPDTVAAAAAAKAVSDHVTLKHVDKFTWDKTEARVRIFKEDGCHISRVCLLDGLEIKNHNISPFDKFQHIELKAWVFTKRKAPDAKSEKIPVPFTLCCDFKALKIDVTDKHCDNNFASSLKDYLNNPANSLPDETAELHFEGFLGLTNDRGIRQIVKIENNLVLKVDLCNVKCDKDECKTPGAASVILDSPFDFQMSDADAEPLFLPPLTPLERVPSQPQRAAALPVLELPLLQ